MGSKTVDLSRSVHDICTEYPEIKQIMISLGFKDLANPAMLQTAGRFMTIPKGAKMKSVDLELIKQRIRELGFEIEEK